MLLWSAKWENITNSGLVNLICWRNGIWRNGTKNVGETGIGEMGIGEMGSYHYYDGWTATNNRMLKMSRANIDGNFDGVFIQNGRLQNEFCDETPPIGSGSFGIVVRVKNRVDDKEYAIKKIVVKHKNDYERKINELKVWAIINSDHFVQYRSAWVEKYDRKSQMELIRQIEPTMESDEFDSWKADRNLTDFAVLHIQMDLCHFSLKEAISRIRQFFGIQDRQLLTPLAYYISAQLLTEIVDCFDFLHKKAIIHRDVKPLNILIKEGPNAKFIKIGDFGMAVLHDQPDLSHSQMRGTVKYMAPEVMTSRRYDTKADVYSIGVMIQEMFNFNINSELSRDAPDHYKRLVKITGLALDGQRRSRLTCADMLLRRNEWALDYPIVRQEVARVIDLNANYDINTQFTQYVIKAKYKFHERN